MTPIRIHRLRKKGWRKPPNTHCVTRGNGARFGNPFLACWCRSAMPCHADVLLEIANAD